MTKPLPIEKLTSPYICKLHRMWLRKGQCEICRLNADKLQQQYEAEHGSNKQEVIIKNV